MRKIALTFVLMLAAAAASAQSLDLYPLGKNFGGPEGAWQFGVDKSATAGACVGYGVQGHQFMVGPCRDVVVLAKQGKPCAHLGAAWLSAASGAGPAARAGINVGPATGEFLRKISGGALYLNNPPVWLSYLGKISTFDYFAGYFAGGLEHGPSIKVDIPLGDLKTLFGIN